MYFRSVDGVGKVVRVDRCVVADLLQVVPALTYVKRVGTEVRGDPERGVLRVVAVEF